ncbi:hypothetical protein ACJIZ3_005188 [Penstemon smallii]|uniref:Nucleolus and neural progenitor protein-like N-terminal domain-containing protein n=1 Tax=Penstemon smallii TaxID=265156 RepID=A0ABD3S4I5_9LAMI
MASEIEIFEQRLTSFMGQLQIECGILERLVYKHKNQHRRCTYFQYVLKVRRDLKLLKSAKLEEILDASFVVINSNRPKQKLQNLESLKKRRCDSDKYNFLERLLGVARLLSQMVEAMLKAATEISTLLAQSFFMKFALTTLAVLARIRVLVQQILVDIVQVYNTVSSLSQKEQTVKLNQQGFEVFREYYPRKEEAIVVLECNWQTDKYVLVERTGECETTRSLEKDDLEDVSLKPSNIQYQNIEVLLGVDESGTTNTEHQSADHPSSGDQAASRTTEASNANLVSTEDISINSSQGTLTEPKYEKSVQDGSCSAESPSDKSPILDYVNHKNETKKKKVAFVSVKPPAPSTTNQLKFNLKGTEESVLGGKQDPFFSLLTAGNDNNSLF